MARIFAANGRGRVSRNDVTKGPVSQLTVNIDNQRLLSVIVTSVTAVYSGRVQTTPAFENALYSYPLGENPVDITVAGISFQLVCDTQTSRKLGFDELNALYESLRASARKEPLAITIGTSAYRALMLSLRNEVTDAETVLGQYVLQFQAVPSRAVRQA